MRSINSLNKSKSGGTASSRIASSSSTVALAEVTTTPGKRKHSSGSSAAAGLVEGHTADQHATKRTKVEGGPSRFGSFREGLSNMLGEGSSRQSQTPVQKLREKRKGQTPIKSKSHLLISDSD